MTREQDETRQRRYDEDEAREIFGIATSDDLAATGDSDDAGALAPAEGFTLAELQGIGSEVGLDPERVARAAAQLDQRDQTPAPRRALGVPVSAHHVVDLPRAPTEREWELLVAELRSTFDARGKVRSEGGLREWWNGNLHALVEPTEQGYRLRLGTRKGDAQMINIMGAFGLVMGVATWLGAGPADTLVGPLLLGGSGLVALAANWIRLPRWASLRERQMRRVGERAVALLAADADDGEQGS